MPIRPEMKARYPQDWKLRSRFVRFVRARGRCEKCGVSHGSIRDKEHPEIVFTEADGLACESWFAGRESMSSKVVLTTAHIYDERPEAAGLLNLAALCQRCHNRHDMKSRRQGTQERKHNGQMDLF